MTELCASAPINKLEIALLGRPVVIEGQGFDIFSKDTDPVKDRENLFKR